MANASLATEFLDKFNSEIHALSERITQGSGADKDALLSTLSKLRKDLIDANSYLPTYDQRQSEIKLKGLEKQLNDLIGATSGVTGKGKAGSKFSFKRGAQPSKVPSTSKSGFGDEQSSKQGEVTNPVNLGSTTDSSKGIQEEPSKGPAFNANVVGFSDRSGEYCDTADIQSASEAEMGTTDISLTSLTGCIINLMDFAPLEPAKTRRSIRAFHAKGLKRCIVMMPYVEGSALIHDCEDCIIAIACHQFRIHTSSQTDLYLHVSSTPIIEKCSKMRFAPYTLPRVSLPEEAFRTESQYANVQDFLWIRPGPSPNWSLLPSGSMLREDQWPTERSELGVGEQLAPLLPKMPDA